MIEYLLENSDRLDPKSVVYFSWSLLHPNIRVQRRPDVDFLHVLGALTSNSDCPQLVTIEMEKPFNGKTETRRDNQFLDINK